MKENKNWVFALKATDNTNNENIELGYIVFPDDKQAFEFMSFSERLKIGNSQIAETKTYIPFNWIVVEQLEADNIHNTGMLFLDKVSEVDTETLKTILEITKPTY